MPEIEPLQSNPAMFKMDKPTGNFMLRYTCLDVEVGVLPVMYGYRVRAGFIGRACVEIDWCCGDDTNLIKTYLQIAIEILEHRLADPTVYPMDRLFKGMPMVSNIKPLHLDHNFVNLVSNLPKGQRDPIDFPRNIAGLREEWFEKRHRETESPLRHGSDDTHEMVLIPTDGGEPQLVRETEHPDFPVDGGR